MHFRNRKKTSVASLSSTSGSMLVAEVRGMEGTVEREQEEH